MMELHFLFLIDFLTYIDFDVYFMMYLIKTSDSPGICEFSTNDKG